MFIPPLNSSFSRLLWLFGDFYNLILKDEDSGCVDTREVPLATPLKEYKELGWRFANKFICSDWEMGVSTKGDDDYVEKYKDRMIPHDMHYLCFYRSND